MAQIVEIFLWVRKAPIHAVNTIVADDLAIQGARLSVALYWLCQFARNILVSAQHVF